MNEIAHVNVKDFGAAGDGTRIDTTAIRNSINALQDGETYLLPAGTYVIDERIFIQKNNCHFFLFGDFKMAGGIQTPYGLITIGGSNNKFYYLSIDGNSNDPTVIDEKAYGISALLVLSENANQITFYETTIKNSMYSAIIFNGKTSNIAFDDMTFRNIGEHCSYVSGGLNRDITFKNAYVENIGLRSNGSIHESYFIKPRGHIYGKNTNFHVENVSLYQSITPAHFAFLMDLNDLDECEIHNASLNGKLFGFTGSNTTGKITITNFNNKGTTDDSGKVFYSDFFTAADITMKNSYIKGYQTSLNSCHRFENCIFEISNLAHWQLSDTSNWTAQHDLIFRDCEFIFYTKSIRYQAVNQNIYFYQCSFKSASNSPVVGDGFLSIGQTSFNPNCLVEFDGGKAFVENFSYSIYTYNSCHLTMKNFTFSKRIRGNSFGALTLLNTKCLELGIYSGTYNKLIAAHVFYNNDDVTEYKGKLTIPKNNTTSPAINLQYRLIRPITVNDVFITPIGNTRGVSYFPVVSNNTLSISCTPAAPTNITFNINIKVNS